ncbi:hypothetical protein GCM10027515_04050 [Schumannella luteola]|uniref:DUF1453 domain-containing protein n=1 Tax=Schumannella luteola TaxID=472059 RepID=A0A852YL44_9MICO|nr:hypothetical protein [Schumannella luteola]NYG98459.1 hypothetical protein [Schumannella luteola]TPX01312.1 hypothetical protein FJ656_28390 [Schumannella luteola]
MILELLEATGRLQELGALVYVVYTIVQELRWRPVETTIEWRVPGIIGLIGLIGLLNTGLLPPSGVDLGLLAIAVVAALGSGAAAGLLTRLRPLAPATRAKLEARRVRGGRWARASIPEHEGRTGWVGVALWVVTLGVRYGIELVGEHLDARIAETTGLALLVVALYELGRSGAIAWRAGRRESQTPSSSRPSTPPPL